MSARTSYEAPGGARYALVAAGTAEDARAAIALIGGQVTGPWPLAEAAAAFDAGAAAVVLDVRDADEDSVLDAAGLVEALGSAPGAPGVVIAFHERQIDAVAGAVLGGRALPLCAPDQAEWITALLAAPARGGGAVREGGDEERIARLEAEVARFARLLAELTPREDTGGGHAAERGFAFAPPPVGDDPHPADIRAVIRARRLRERFFGPGLLEDPAWDILLDLFAARLEDRKVSVSSLCIAAAVPSTTGLRWIARLTEVGLLTREPDARDRRRAFVTLTDAALAGMRGFVAGAREAGLPLV